VASDPAMQVQGLHFSSYFDSDKILTIGLQVLDTFADTVR
jgi:hypothetical protein